MSVDGVTFHAALEALARGESLIAVGPDKKPWYPWGRYQLEAADERQVCKWARGSWTRAFAVVTGGLSGIVVIDLDDNIEWLLGQLGDVEPHVRTGRGGFHVRVPHPGFRVATQNSKVTVLLKERWPGLDIRGDGGYAIEYGESCHGRYVHLRDLAELVPVSALPPAMAADVGLLGPVAPRGGTPATERRSAPPTPRTDGWVLEGHRHRHLFAIACAMRGRGCGADRMLAELRYVNATECRPPKDDELLVALVHDVVRRYPTDREKRAVR